MNENDNKDRNNSIKITFTGDLLCNMFEIPAYKTSAGEYNFDDIFIGLKEYFSACDYVVGNLETPIANSDTSFKRYQLNSPVEFIKAVKDNGFTMVTTANNHCMDRGVTGLEETIKNLDFIGLKHTGTNLQNIFPTGILEDIEGIKIGFLSYTYGTNAFENNNYLCNEEKWKVNLYQEQELHNPSYRRFYNSSFYKTIRKNANSFSQFLTHKNLFCPVHDRIEKGRKYFLKKMKNDILALKEKGAEYIIMCLHAGGQYNSKPLAKTKKIIKQIANMEADAIITIHEHVIHSGVLSKEKIILYSLGNFTSQSGANKSPFDQMTEYSILFNLYLSRSDNIIKPSKLTFAIAKSIPIDDRRVKTVLLYDLIKKCTNPAELSKLLHDNLIIYNLFRNSKEKEIELELEYPFASIQTPHKPR